jgi:hypothetical protein
VIAQKSRGWTIWWADVGSFGPGGAFQTLDWLVQATDALLRESGGAFQSLDQLVQATDGLVLGRDPTGSGCLQYMIYPSGRPGVGDEHSPFDLFLIEAPAPGSNAADPVARPAAVFHISGRPGNLQATEITRVCGLEFRGRTAGDLVAQAAKFRGSLPDKFVWIREIESLQHAD